MKLRSLGSVSASQLRSLYRTSLSGFFCPEDGSDIFLRNVGSYKTHTAPHPIKTASFIVTAVKTSDHTRNFLIWVLFCLRSSTYHTSWLRQGEQPCEEHVLVLAPIKNERLAELRRLRTSALLARSPSFEKWWTSEWIFEQSSDLQCVNGPGRDRGKGKLTSHNRGV
jgi:hypothetical protein